MKQYYCLVAGLPDISLDDGKLSYTVDNFKADIYPELSKEDKKLIDLFYLKYDNENLLKLLNDKDATVSQRSNYTSDDLLELISSVKDGDLTGSYPSYLYKFLSEYFQSSEEYALPGNLLAAYYYEYAMNSKNEFVAAWFEFNLNLNNILTALTARKYKMEVAPNIVGETEVTDALKHSNTRDFGLSTTLTYFDQLTRINETSELIEKERKIDMLKWDWMEEESFFNYFTIEKLFVFLMKLEMIERWISLDKETGNQLFRQLIGTLKSEIEIPSEFR